MGSNDKITETSNTLTVSVTLATQLGTYGCTVDNGIDIDDGRGNVTIVEGSKFLCIFVKIDLCMMMLHCNRLSVHVQFTKLNILTTFTVIKLF